jgi:hypothetical protein
MTARGMLVDSVSCCGRVSFLVPRTLLEVSTTPDNNLVAPAKDCCTTEVLPTLEELSTKVLNRSAAPGEFSAKSS